MEWKITNTSELKQYGSEINQMYIDSYSKIGAIAFVDGFDGMSNYYPCSAYMLNDTKDILQGIILYWKSDYGNKIGLVISLNADIGKQYVVPKLCELLKTPGFYVELSDALEYLVRKSGITNIKDKSLILQIIQDIKETDIFYGNDERRNQYKLGKEPSPEGSYLRYIYGIGIHRKAIYGIPCFKKKFNRNNCARKCINTGGRRITRKRVSKKFLRKSS